MVQRHQWRNNMTFKKDIKLMAFVASAMFWGSGYAADNSVYIDQAGDNSTIAVTQDGSGNRIKGILANGTAGATTDHSVLAGDNQTVTIQQVGQNNVLSLGLKTAIGANGKGIDLTYIAINGGNTAYINSNNAGTGQSQGNTVNINQSGGSALTNLNLLGNDNNLNVTTTGGANNKFTAAINANQTVTTVNQSGGGGNETTLNMTGNDAQVSITTVGASNITNLTQSAAGAAGAQVLIDIIGSGNTTNVTQSGAFDHYADIKLRSGSNDNTIGLIQSGGAGSGHSTTLELLANSTNNTISITQQGAVSNLSNIKISGSHNSYTVLQK